MRAFFIGLAIQIAVSTTNSASAEIVYPFCRVTSNGTNCGFTSREQCQGGGLGGFCVENPSYTGRR